LKTVLQKFPKFTMEDLLSKIREWYNGYSWDGEMRVYNPYSILLFLDKEKFENHWFKTGTPRFLLDLLKDQKMFNFNNLRVSGELIESYEIEHIDVRTLFFQTGYLTIKEVDNEFDLYVLDYPNREVEQAMTTQILAVLKGGSPFDSLPPVLNIREAFLKNDVPKVIQIINAMLKDVPALIIDKKDEHFYHALVHLHFKFLGIYMDSEVHTSDGRMDAVVKTPSHIYILEFKIDQTAQTALEQIKNKDYAAKYTTDTRQKVGIGINFNTEKKAIDDWVMLDF
jgi:hypothetical protein